VRILPAGVILYAVFELLHVYAFFNIVFSLMPLAPQM